MRCLNNIPHALSQQIYNKAFSLFLKWLKSAKFRPYHYKKDENAHELSWAFLFVIRVLQNLSRE